VLEKQRCHFIYFLAHKLGSAPPEEGAGPVQAEDASDNNNNNSEHQEGAEDNEESILGSLSPLFDDVSTTTLYEAFCKALEDTEDASGESSPPKKVFATIIGGEDDEDEDSHKTTTGASIPAPA
jgi:hypothetical protein